MKRFLKSRRSFKKEFRWQLRLALDAAIGFTIAFAWRNAIFDTLHKYVSELLDLAPEHFTTEIYTAILITLLGVFALFATSKLLRSK